jgi:hypothetical protein
MLRFPYQDEILLGPAPPTLAASATHRYRPLVPITFLGAQGQSIHFGRALVDPGADDTILPYDLVTIWVYLFVLRHSTECFGAGSDCRYDTGR